MTVYEQVMKVLEGHCRGHYHLDQAVDLLEKLWRQSQSGQKDVENALRVTLSSEPLAIARPVGPFSPDILRVAVRAIATFGPTAQLPTLVFARLPSQKADLMDVWAQGLCLELSYSMLHHADRFSQATLDATKAYCAPYTYSGSAELIGSQFTQTVLHAAVDLERTIEHIEYHRFAAGLAEGTDQAATLQQATDPKGLLAALQFPKEIAAAMDKAESYLGSDEPFSPKNAGDLIRTAMEEVHRAVVQELGNMSGHQCERPQLDGARREYMRQSGFITTAEETFFSAIYTLISDEASHKLDAPRETMLVMLRTVRDYMQLLLERLIRRRTSRPATP